MKKMKFSTFLLALGVVFILSMAIQASRKITTTEIQKDLYKLPDIPKKWEEEKHKGVSIMYITVTSDSTTGTQWINRLENKGFTLDSYAKKILSKHLYPSEPTRYKIAIIKNTTKRFLGVKEWTTEDVYDLRDQYGFKTPSIELSCLIGEALSIDDIRDMGIVQIIVPHDVVNFGRFDNDILSFDQRFSQVYGDWFGSFIWAKCFGFAFIASETKL